MDGWVLVTLGTAVISFGRDVAEGMGWSNGRTLASCPERNLALCTHTAITIEKNKTKLDMQWVRCQTPVAHTAGVLIITIILFPSAYL
jgi:hypothetical protein